MTFTESYREGQDERDDQDAEYEKALAALRRYRFGDPDAEPRFTPDSLSPSGWPTDEDGYEM